MSPRAVIEEEIQEVRTDTAAAMVEMVIEDVVTAVVAQN
jgi:hypothetical protein